MHKSFRLSNQHDESVSTWKLRKRPVLVHLSITVIGVFAFLAVFFYLDQQTDNLNIFPQDKRYLGAALCMLACFNANYFTYHFLRSLVSYVGILSKEDAALLSPFVRWWPSQWYTEQPPQLENHPLDNG